MVELGRNFFKLTGPVWNGLVPEIITWVQLELEPEYILTTIGFHTTLFIPRNPFLVFVTFLFTSAPVHLFLFTIYFCVYMFFKPVIPFYKLHQQGSHFLIDVFILTWEQRL